MPEKEKIKIQCSDCGRLTPHANHGQATETEDIEIEGENRSIPIDFYHLLLQCEICNTVSLHYSPESEDDLYQLYPVKKNLSGIPPKIQESYEEAKKVERISPISFAVMIRRALEYVCNEQNASGEDLNQQLNDLSNRNIIPTTLARMSHALRYFGNIGAHANDLNIGKGDASMMDDFFLAVVEYVYIAPEKLKRANERVKKSK